MLNLSEMDLSVPHFRFIHVFLALVFFDKTVLFVDCVHKKRVLHEWSVHVKFIKPVQTLPEFHVSYMK